MENVTRSEVGSQNGDNLGLTSVVERRRFPEEETALTGWLAFGPGTSYVGIAV